MNQEFTWKNLQNASNGVKITLAIAVVLSFATIFGSIAYSCTQIAAERHRLDTTTSEVEKSTEQNEQTSQPEATPVNNSASNKVGITETETPEESKPSETKAQETPKTQETTQEKSTQSTQPTQPAQSTQATSSSTRKTIDDYMLEAYENGRYDGYYGYYGASHIYPDDCDAKCQDILDDAYTEGWYGY